MDRRCYYNNVTHRNRVVTRFGDGVEVPRGFNEVEVSNPPAEYSQPVRPTPPPVSAATLEHRRRLKLMLTVQVVNLAIDQGYFDRLKIDG